MVSPSAWPSVYGRSLPWHQGAVTKVTVYLDTVKQEIFTTWKFREIASQTGSRQEKFANIEVEEFLIHDRKFSRIRRKSRNSRKFSARENFLFYSIWDALLQLYPFNCSETGSICRKLWSLITLTNREHSGTTQRDLVTWRSIPPPIYPGDYIYHVCRCMVYMKNSPLWTTSGPTVRSDSMVTQALCSNMHTLPKKCFSSLFHLQIFKRPEGIQGRLISHFCPY